MMAVKRSGKDFQNKQRSMAPKAKEKDVSRGRKQPVLRSYAKAMQVRPLAAAGPAGVGWKVTDLLSAYSWPTNRPGGGVIAIIASFGGWRQDDVSSFMESIGQPAPVILDIPIDGANAPGIDDQGDMEVALDLQLAAASYSYATGLPATIRVYWTSLLLKGIQTAANDGCDVCSISWGANESQWSTIAAKALELAAQQATTAGMVVLGASGDNDSSDGGPGDTNVDLPASCPHVIGCGGTRKTAVGESVWNDNPGVADGQGTGGGFSQIFTPLPAWQIGAPNGPGRMVPDVSANADPTMGYQIIVNGNEVTAGGTSAVPPLYAGLFASFGRKLGFITESLWRNPMCFNDITSGDNGVFRADRGPDACTGLGSPIGTKIASLFK